MPESGRARHTAQWGEVCWCSAGESDGRCGARVSEIQVGVRIPVTGPAHRIPPPIKRGSVDVQWCKERVAYADSVIKISSAVKVYLQRDPSVRRLMIILKQRKTIKRIIALRGGKRGDGIIAGSRRAGCAGSLKVAGGNHPAHTKAKKRISREAAHT